MAVAGGSLVVLMIGLLRSRFARHVLVPALTAVALATAIGLSVWIWEPGDSRPIIAGALAVDPLALGISVLIYISGIVDGAALAAGGRRARGRARRVLRAAAGLGRAAWSCSRRPRA